MKARIFIAGGVAAFSIGAHAEVITPTELKWKPSSVPGLEFAVIDGDLTKPGPFAMRVKYPDGFKLAPHTHPVTERITVIQGGFSVGEGEKYDDSKLKAVPVGSFIVNTDGAPHFSMAKGETIIQIHGTGPWGIKYVNPEDDPSKKQKSQ
jgi:anti-sigma factor ChrR (cupin superfamily)